MLNAKKTNYVLDFIDYALLMKPYIHQYGFDCIGRFMRDRDFGVGKLSKETFVLAFMPQAAQLLDKISKF